MDRPSGMAGKKYATWDMDLEKATIKQVVEKDGGDFEKVELIPSTVTDEVSALKSKSVDAIWIFYGWAGVAAEIAADRMRPDYAPRLITLHFLILIQYLIFIHQ